MTVETRIREAAERQVAAAPERTLHWSDIEAAIARDSRRAPLRRFGVATAAAAAIVAAVVVIPRLDDDRARVMVPFDAPSVQPSVVWSKQMGGTTLERTMYATGTIDGVEWRLQVYTTSEPLVGDGVPCDAVELAGTNPDTDNDQALHCEDATTGFVLSATSGVLAGADARFVYGGVSRAAAEIRVRLADGRVISTSPIDASPKLGYGVWVIAIADRDAEPVEVTAYDASGEKLGERVLERYEVAEGR